MKVSELIILKERWTSEQRLKGQAALMGKSVPPLPVIDGKLIDLRGLEISEVIERVEIKLFDLSAIRLDGFGQFARCNVESCKFLYASLETNIGGNFHMCDFRSAKLTGAVLRGEFVDCDFSMANLSRVIGTKVKFLRCVFSNVKFNSAMLLHCVFEDCKFEECMFRNSSFSFSRFNRSPLENVDLENALMRSVKFTNDI